MRASLSSRSSIEWVLLFFLESLSLWSDLSRFQVLNASIDDNKLRNRCLRGLEKISAGWGLLPKSYWIAQSGLTQPSVASSTTGRVFDTCKRSMGKEFVAVKTINPNYIGDFNTFKKVRLTSSSKRLSPVLYLMGSCRNCALVRLCGNECDIQMLSVSLDLAQILLSSASSALGCQTVCCTSTCTSTLTSISLAW